MTTPTASPTIDRARPVTAGHQHCVSATHATARTMSTALRSATPANTTDQRFTTIAMNLWLGGDEQGFGSEFVTKRTTPGHLEALT